jgi:hypothetical protein
MYQLAAFAAVSGGLFAFAPFMSTEGPVTPFNVALNRAGTSRGGRKTPKKARSNRLHIGRRVRRKHKRAAMRS